jgi:ribose 5-phosphate isomerase B
MNVIIGADHRGFSLKEQLIPWLKEKGYTVLDKGAVRYVKDDDYTVFATDVSQSVLQTPDSLGILLCGSGVGVTMVANKIKRVRCGLALSKEQVIAARKDDDISVLAVAADYTPEDKAKEMVEAFLTTPFSQETRHQKRLSEITTLEESL